MFVWNKAVWMDLDWMKERWPRRPERKFGRCAFEWEGERALRGLIGWMTFKARDWDLLVCLIGCQSNVYIVAWLAVGRRDDWRTGCITVRLFPMVLLW